jgi:hypothetical protein
MNVVGGVRDVVLLIVIAWFGASVVATRVLGWHRQEPHALITLGDSVVLLLYVAWVAGAVVIMLVARTRQRSGWAWFAVAYTVSPPVAWILLWTLTRDRSGRAPAAASPMARGPWSRIANPATTVVGLLVLAILVTGAAWWWTRPTAESLTQRLWRECHDTLAYTNPEWDERHLDVMTRRCMEHRLLGTR